MILLLTPALWSNFHELSVQWKGFKSAPASNEVTKVRLVVDSFKEAVPSQERIGYISDSPQDKAAETLDVMLLQTHFIPTLVVRSTDPAFVVAHIRNSADASNFAAKNGLTIVRTYSDGFVLLKHQLSK